IRRVGFGSEAQCLFRNRDTNKTPSAVSCDDHDTGRYASGEEASMTADGSQQAPPEWEPRGIGRAEPQRWLVPANADELPALRRALSEWAVEAGLSTDTAEMLVLASYEAMANVVEHAYTDNGGTIELTVTGLPVSGQARVTVTDEGRW